MTVTGISNKNISSGSTVSMAAITSNEKRSFKIGEIVICTENNRKYEIKEIINGLLTVQSIPQGNIYKCQPENIFVHIAYNQEVSSGCSHKWLPSRNTKYSNWCSVCGEYK